ncbi:transporter [Streptomyces albidoflavus]|uniref:Transporter n=1 Tax=Streptomyces albidoflavus TaxID=1886 RepID=A0ABY3H261_9ACTN|nr:transporter [Streptomyces albidoflavus]RZF08490.1 transporter [Streptomyces albidoflavus]TWV24762.1 transporter [Streptomyces albidoflavus]
MSDHATTAPAPLPPAAAGPPPPPPGGRPLTATLVRLKLSLLRNGLRQSSGRRAAYIASAVVSLLFAALLVLGLVALRGHPYAPTVTLSLTAALALGWAVMPLFFPSGDETLDPTRLVMLPLRPEPLVRSLLVASLVGLGPFFTLCLLTGSLVALAHGWAAAAVAIPAGVLALLVCVALARAVAAANTRLLTSRKGRDLAVLSGLIIAVGAQVVNFAVQRIGSAGGLSQLDPAVAVLRWIPPVSALSSVTEAGRGQWGQALAQLVLTVAALGLLLLWWRRSLTKLMTAPDGSTLGAAEGPARKNRADRASRLTLFSYALAPAGRERERTAAVIERSLRYMWRDPKTKAAWITSLAIGLIVPVFNAVQGSGSVYLACFAAGMLGVQMYNQFGQDTSAFWMVALTISSARDAYVELRARALALLTVTLPYATLVTVLTAALLGAWTELPEALGLSYALLGAMTATGAWASARYAYSIPQEGNKNVAPGQAGLAWISVLGGMVAGAALCLPLLGLQIGLHVGGAHGWLWVMLPAGIGYGVLLAYAGLRVAAPRTAGRLPEILGAVSRG